MTITHKITVPENIGDITLRQYLKHEELLSRSLDEYNHNRRKLALFSGIPFKDTAHMKSSDYNRLLSQIDTALNTEAEFTPMFTMHGIEFGFVPNIDAISMGEYADICTYGVEKETLHRLMAILFRPVIKKDGDKYEVMGYNGTEEYAEMMMDMPMHCVNGALVFFYNLANELQTATQRYLTRELMREMQPPTTSKISAGMQPLRDWLKTTSLTFQKSKRSTYTNA